MHSIQRSVSRAALAVLAALAAPGCSLFETTFETPVDRSHEPKYLVNRDSNGLALQGYDPVAYFTDKKPVMGTTEFRTKLHGATYQFASKEHLAMFEADPGKYEPAFGGWCGYAVSIDKLSPISPEFFEILDGRLVLQHNERAWKAWHEDVAGNLKKADANWPGLVAENAAPEKVLVNVDEKGVALEGRDPVAYFTVGKPVLGQATITATYNGAIYWFTSVDDKNTFEKEPAKYAPQFGGFCGYAASINKVSPVNVNLFQIINGRLVLQHTDEAYRLFNEDAQKNLMRADEHWPGLVERRGA